jgi:hypothetical protein
LSSRNLGILARLVLRDFLRFVGVYFARKKRSGGFCAVAAVSPRSAAHGTSR